MEKATIIDDLQKERPQHILSAYGPGHDAPLQLFGGLPREQCFEELRLRHYELAAQGKTQLAIQEAQDLVRTAEQQNSTALSDVQGAIKYICSGESQHPNRNDICKAKGTTQNQSQNALFASSGNPTSAVSAFGKPTMSVHGQPSRVQSGSFGQPSLPTFGQPSNSPSAPLAQPEPSRFGQTTTFGRPSGLGQPPLTFGKPTASTTTFGQPSTFGTPQNGTAVRGDRPNPFAQTSTQIQPSTLTQPVGNSQNSFFNTATGGSPFAQAASTTSSSLLPATFANSSSASAPTNAVTATSGPGGLLAGTANSFTQPALQQSSSISGQAGSASTPMANATAPRRPNASLGGGGVQVQKDGQGKIRSWNGREVQYLEGEPCFRENGHSEWHRIWFPDGPPNLTKVEDLAVEIYDSATRENYLYTKNQGTFKDGVMPFLPPRREWCDWDF